MEDMDTVQLAKDLQRKKDDLEIERANQRLEITQKRARVKEIDAELVKVKRLINACQGRKPRNKLTPLETGI